MVRHLNRERMVSFSKFEWAFPADCQSVEYLEWQGLLFYATGLAGADLSRAASLWSMKGVRCELA